MLSCTFKTPLSTHMSCILHPEHQPSFMHLSYSYIGTWVYKQLNFHRKIHTVLLFAANLTINFDHSSFCKPLKLYDTYYTGDSSVIVLRFTCTFTYDDWLTGHPYSLPHAIQTTALLLTSHVESGVWAKFPLMFVDWGDVTLWIPLTHCVVKERPFGVSGYIASSGDMILCNARHLTCMHWFPSPLDTSCRQQSGLFQVLKSLIQVTLLSTSCAQIVCQDFFHLSTSILERAPLSVFEVTRCCQQFCCLT